VSHSFGGIKKKWKAFERGQEKGKGEKINLQWGGGGGGGGGVWWGGGGGVGGGGGGGGGGVGGGGKNKDLKVFLPEA